MNSQAPERAAGRRRRPLCRELARAENAARDAATPEELASESARRLAGAGRELESWTPQDAAQAYEVRGGALGWYRPIKDDGAQWTPLATFDAAITEETERDDGSADVTKVWRVRVTLPGGSSGETDITPDQLARPQQWAAKAAGSGAVVMPGPLIVDHLRVAVPRT